MNLYSINLFLIQSVINKLVFILVVNYSHVYAKQLSATSTSPVIAQYVPGRHTPANLDMHAMYGNVSWVYMDDGCPYEYHA